MWSICIYLPPAGSRWLMSTAQTQGAMVLTFTLHVAILPDVRWLLKPWGIGSRLRPSS